jgi:transcriptional regulator with XRE-family HTH domain
MLRGMTLREYLEAMKISESKFADRIGVSQAAINRYCNGRAPRGEIMKRIMAETEGKVTANDWYVAAAE